MLIELCCDVNWEARNLLLVMLRVEFLRLAIMQGQILVMNTRILVTMTCDDLLCQQMMPEILEAIRKISRSEPMTTMKHLPGDDHRGAADRDRIR
jgi:hypothetical protein